MHSELTLRLRFTLASFCWRSGRRVSSTSAASVCRYFRGARCLCLVAQSQHTNGDTAQRSARKRLTGHRSVFCFFSDATKHSFSQRLAQLHSSLPAAGHVKPPLSGIAPLLCPFSPQLSLRAVFRLLRRPISLQHLIVPKSFVIFLYSIERQFVYMSAMASKAASTSARRCV